MGELVALAMLLMLGGSSKKKSESTTTELGWTGYIGAAKFTATGLEGLRVILQTEGMTGPDDATIKGNRGDGTVQFKVQLVATEWRATIYAKAGLKSASAVFTRAAATKGEAIELVLARLEQGGFDDASKLPDATPSSPDWSGRIGAVNFAVVRTTGAWRSTVDGVAAFHATAFLALRAAMLDASQKANATAPLFMVASPFVFEGIATRQPGVVEVWKWHVRVPEAGTTLLDGVNDAIAEATTSNRNDALGEIITWARPYTEGKTAHG